MSPSGWSKPALDFECDGSWVPPASIAWTYPAIGRERHSLFGGNAGLPSIGARRLTSPGVVRVDGRQRFKQRFDLFVGAHRDTERVAEPMGREVAHQDVSG